MKWIILFIMVFIGLASAETIVLNSSTPNSYVLNTNTIFQVGKGNTKAIIGNESGIFTPRVRFNWMGEANAIFDYPDVAISLPTIYVENHTLVYDRLNYQLRYFELDTKTYNSEGGGLEMAIVLKKLLPITEITLPLNLGDFEFLYQPPLSQWNLEWEDCTDTHCFDKEGIETAYLPEYAVGSYAVYHSSKRNNQYGTGKVMHIYRPMLIDAFGRKAYGTLNVSNGKLTIKLPTAWLQTAAYPVTIDPSFGYTTVGAGGYAITNYSDGVTYIINNTQASDGTITEAHVYAALITGGTATIKVTAWAKGTTCAATNFTATTAETEVNASARWWDITMSGDLYTGKFYTVGYKGQNTVAYSLRVYGDAGSYGDYRSVTDTDMTSPTTLNGCGSSSIRVSNYVNYTEGGEPAFTPAFYLNISSPLNNTIYASGFDFDLNITIYGNATGYNASYSLDGAANTTIGNILNGTNNRTNIGVLSSGLHNITVFAQNGTVLNHSYVNFSVVAAPDTISFTVLTLGGGGNSTNSMDSSPGNMTEGYYFNATGVYSSLVKPCADAALTNCQDGMSKPMYEIINTGTIEFDFYLKVSGASPTLPQLGITVCANSTGTGGATNLVPICSFAGDGNLNTTWGRFGTIGINDRLNITEYANFSYVYANIITRTEYLNST